LPDGIKVDILDVDRMEGLIELDYKDNDFMIYKKFSETERIIHFVILQRRNLPLKYILRSLCNDKEAKVEIVISEESE
jgi:hypothetical protein